MKATIKDVLIGNLLTVIIIFILLNFFDQSGEAVRNIILVLTGFMFITAYDILKIIVKKDSK